MGGAPEDAFEVTVSPEAAPDQAQLVEVGFEHGVPETIDGAEMGLVELIGTIDAIGGAHGFGRVDMIENRLVGIKSREIYEVPGALALITAHKELEDLVLTRDLIHFKRTIEAKLADMIYEGQWFDPLTEACKSFLFSTQERVSGAVRLRFYKGTCTAEGRRSANTLYNYKLATYSKEDEFSHTAAAGFTELWGLPIEMWARVGKEIALEATEMRHASERAPQLGAAERRRRGGTMSKARSGRFASERSAAFVALNSSLALDWRLWPEDIEGSAAHARALERAGVLTAAEREAVEGGLAAVAAEIEAGTFVPRDDDEDVHMAIERRLTELAGAPGAKLHTARSRNDQVVTDVRLHLRRVIEGQRAALRGIEELLLVRAEPHLETVMPAYTHLQRAQVTSLAHHLLAWFWMLERDRDRFAVALDACLELPLGAGAAAGLNYELDRAAVAAELGFEQVAPNSLDAVADRDFAADYLTAAAQLAGHLSRIGAEIVLWASAEFGFVALPDAVSGGSSIMPQKRNPDAAELMRAAGPRVAADLQGLLGTLHGLPLAYNTDLREDKRYLFDGVDCLAVLLPVVHELLAGMAFDNARMAAACGSFLMATDVADELVARGLPFREAHHVTGALVRRCLDLGCELGELPPDELAALSPALATGLAGLIDAQRSLAAKVSPGGSAPARVREQLALAREALEV